MTGIGILQLHTLGLSEEEAKQLKIDGGSSHVDIRMNPNGKEYWEGGEFMIGNAKFFTKKFESLNKGGKLLFNFKVPRTDERNNNGEPPVIKGGLAWLKIGADKPAIFEPGTVGALADTYATMIALEKFKWTALEQKDSNGKPHFKKFIIEPTWVNKDFLKKLNWDSNKAPLQGILEFSLVPVNNGRKWMASYGSDKMKEIFIAKDDVKHEVTGIVYEPNTVDADGDWMTEEDIEEAQRSFVLDNGDIYFHHQEEIDAKPVENWIAPSDIIIKDSNGNDVLIKKGTWLMTVKVFNKDMWDKIESGEIKGFSMRGSAIPEED